LYLLQIKTFLKPVTIEIGYEEIFF
jgi:hypothetical protein